MYVQPHVSNCHSNELFDTFSYF